MPISHLELVTLLTVAGLLMASQHHLAAPISQQQPKQLLQNPINSTATSRQQQGTCDNINANSSIHIEDVGLLQEDVMLDLNDVASMIHCPVMNAVAIKPRCIKSPEADRLKKQVGSIITVCQWFKDSKPIHRHNGNPIVRSLQDANSVSMPQITPSDAATYRCTIDYSKVLGELDTVLAKDCLTLYNFLQFQVKIDDSDPSLPDLPSQILHPPFATPAELGQDVTFTCKYLETQLSNRVDWFRSNCSATNNNVTAYDACKNEFYEAYQDTRTQQKLRYISPYFIDDIDGDEFTVKNITEDDVDTYGCVVSNTLGLDIRLANLSLYYHMSDGTPIHFPPPIPPRVSSVHQSINQTETWIIALVVVSFMVCLALICTYILCCTRYGLKLFNHSPLLKKMVGEEKPKEDTSCRQHLPKAGLPDLCSLDKPEECCIYGHFNQKNGHLMDQSRCDPTLIMEKSPSISSNNYQPSDVSSSWGKSLSSNGDSSRAFYQHTSNHTSTTVHLYDPVPSKSTSQPKAAPFQNHCVINPTYGFLRPIFDPTYPNWTFSRRHLEPQEMIGKGQFGEVWRYVAHQKDGTASFVAVKKLTVRSGLELQARDDILKEIEIMRRVNDHPNVIKFLNTCEEPTTVLLIMEYADNGTLQAYLRKCRYSKDGDLVTSKELLKYSYHVAKGMEYIASKGIVHRDLASRNILLSKEKTCKIADFGLARFVGECGIYHRLDRNQPVPIKWMAPESLTEHGTYTSKSDVFSVGVLMWEIVTLGATPYDFLPSSEVLKKVVNGGRLSRPEHCKEEFYNIMDRCWHQDPAMRPTFKELADELEVLLQSENDYIQLDKYPEHAYYNINTSKDAEKEMVTPLPIYPELDNVLDQC